MTTSDFTTYYESTDDDEMARIEQFHTDLKNTLLHFAGTSEIDNMDEVSISDLFQFLDETTNL